MTDPRLDELAALRALDLLTEAERAELRLAMDRDKGARRLVRDYHDTAAAMACAVPSVAPPAGLKQEIMDRLPASKAGVGSKGLSWSSWIAYAIAACLMFLGIYQAVDIVKLQGKLRAQNLEVTELKQHNDLMGVRIATLEAKDASLVSAKVVVAWDPKTHQGVISIHNLPAPAPGHDYQLWVIDPSVKGAINAGLLTSDRVSQPFQATPQTGSPGFAISLEPSGGKTFSDRFHSFCGGTGGIIG